MSGTGFPTLAEISVMKVGMSLHNDREITQWSKFEDPCDIDIPAWHDSMKEKISKLCLPADLHERTFEVASRQCLFIVQIQEAHSRLSSVLGRSCQCLDGILEWDYVQPSDCLFNDEETIEQLIRDERIDDEFRYVLAFLIDRDNEVDIPDDWIFEQFMSYNAGVDITNGFIWRHLFFGNIRIILFLQPSPEKKKKMKLEL